MKQKQTKLKRETEKCKIIDGDLNPLIQAIKNSADKKKNSNDKARLNKTSNQLDLTKMYEMFHPRPVEHLLLFNDVTKCN